MERNETNHGKTSRTTLILAVVVLGSLCGLVEVVGGGLLKQWEFPFRSGLLVGLGFGVIAFGLAIFKKPVIALFIGLFAVLSKQLAVVALHMPLMCMANSNLAVLIEYGMLAGVATIMMGGMKSNLRSRILAGGSAAALGSIAFYFIGMHAAPCAYLLSFNSAGGFVSYLAKESLSWTVAAAVFFPIGWTVGQRFSERTLAFLSVRPNYFYVGSVLLTAICWVSSTYAMSIGF